MECEGNFGVVNIVEIFSLKLTAFDTCDAVASWSSVFQVQLQRHAVTS